MGKNIEHTPGGTKQKPKKTRRVFDDEYKINALTLLAANNGNQEATAKELKVSNSLISTWLKDPRYNKEYKKGLKRGPDMDIEMIEPQFPATSIIEGDLFNDPVFKSQFEGEIKNTIDRLGILLPRAKTIYELTTALKALADAHDQFYGKKEESEAGNITQYIQQITNNYHEKL